MEGTTLFSVGVCFRDHGSYIEGTAKSTYTGSTVFLLLQKRVTDDKGEGGLHVIKESWASVKEGKNFIQPCKSCYPTCPLCHYKVRISFLSCSKS